MFNKIFKTRWALIVFPAILLFCLSMLSVYFTTPYINNNAPLKSQKDPTKDLIFISFVILKTDDKGRIFAVDNKGQSFLLDTRIEPLLTDTRYSLTGYLSAAGTFKVEDYQVHPYRTLKHFVSGLSLVIIFYLFMRYIRLDAKHQALIVIKPGKGPFSI